jgi:hypothetical protein
MNQNDKYLKIIQQSSIIFKIKKTASEIFDFCKKHTDKQYPNFYYNFDVNKIQEQLEDSFSDALRILLEEKKEKRTIPGWSEGFFFGYLSSKLSLYWYSEYVYPQTKEYKELMFLKAVISYIKFDGVTTSRIEKIYNHLIKNKINNIENMYENDEKIILFEKFKNKKIQNGYNPKFSDSLVEYLESILLQTHQIIFDRISIDNDFLNLQNFFSDSEILDLISLAESQRN